MFILYVLKKWYLCLAWCSPVINSILNTMDVWGWLNRSGMEQEYTPKCASVTVFMRRESSFTTMSAGSSPPLNVQVMVPRGLAHTAHCTLTLTSFTLARILELLALFQTGESWNNYTCYHYNYLSVTRGRSVQLLFMEMLMSYMEDISWKVVYVCVCVCNSV